MSPRSLGLITGVVLASLLACPPASYADGIARGDSAWARRAEGESGGRPSPELIREAVSAYEDVLAVTPGSLEARWKLLRALHFEGDFAEADEEEARRVFDRAVSVSERSLDLLAEQVGSPVRLDELDHEQVRDRLAGTNASPLEVARLYFWSAINWGAWSRNAGLLSAVRQGVANRIHRYVLIASTLEPGYEEGGAFRLLGRLHAELPRVPFVSGWVDREASIPLLERAQSLAPTNPGNRLLLALTLLDLDPERRREALDLLTQVAELVPRPSMRIEDIAMRKEARERLAQEHAASP